MALTDKDIIITPNRGQTAEPKIEFRGASGTLGPQTITLNVYPENNGTVSFEGSAGQLFSVTNSLTGSIFSVNDVSGIPSIEVLDTGIVRLAQYSGNVLIGTATDSGQKFQVAGTTALGTNLANYLTVTGATAGNAVNITTAGSDANIGLTITTKGTGNIILDTGTSTGDIELKPGLSSFRLYDDDSSHYYRFVTGNRTANYDINLPAGNVTLTAGTTVVTDATNQTIAGTKTFSSQVVLSVATGTAPLSVTSTTLVSNLNVDKVDGIDVGTITAAGGIVYATSTTALAGTAAGTSGQPLLSGAAGAPTWGTLSAGAGGTGQTSYAVGDILYASAAGTLSKLAGVATGNALISGGVTTAPSWGKIGLTTHVSGTLPIANGGTNSTATPTNGGVAYGTGTAIGYSAAGTSGQVLVSAGAAAPAFAAFDLSVHAPDSSYKKVVRVATTADLAASTFAANVLTGYDDTFTLACTTTAGSATVTTTSTAGIRVGAVVSGNPNIPAAYTVASIVSATQFTLNSGTSVVAATSITTTFTQTIAALSIDGVAMVLNDRVLVKDQRTLGGLLVADAAKYNGIYTVTAIGSTTVPWTLTRAGDADSSTDIDSAVVNVSVGTANFGKTYKTRFSGTSTLNTTEMYWGRVADVNSSSLAALPTTARGVHLDTDTETTMFKAGNVTDLTMNALGITTVQAVTASTYTRASTLYIAGAPVASTNATITTPYSLYIAGGNSYLGSNVSLAGTLTSTIATGTAPLAVTSTTRVANLNVATAGTADTWTTTRTITIGSTGKSVNGSGNVSWTLAEIGAQKLTVIQDGAPAGTAGDLWWDSDAGTLNIYYGSTWVEVNPSLGATSNPQFNSIGVGRAAPGVAGNMDLNGTLHVSRNNATGGGIILADDGDIVDLNDAYCAMRFSSGVRIHAGNRTGAAVITLGSNGAILATNDITAYSSDQRLKTNVVPLKNSLEKVHSLVGATFDWIDGIEDLGFKPTFKVDDAGLLAQQVQAVLPQAVALAPFDNDGKGNSKSGNNYLTVKYEKLVPLLVEAIKEMDIKYQTIIKDLKNEIEVLKGVK